MPAPSISSTNVVRPAGTASTRVCVRKAQEHTHARRHVLLGSRAFVRYHGAVAARDGATKNTYYGLERRALLRLDGFQPLYLLPWPTGCS